MKAKNLLNKFIFTLGHLMPGAALFLFTRPAAANPTGPTVQSGTASFSVNGSQYTVTVGNNAQLNWQSFNIASGEKTIFNQPSASSVVWNRINDPNPSQIYGSLQANGVVVLLNSSGFYFGPNSFVSAAGLVVSTANYQPPQNAGGAWVFNGPPSLASIVNYGQIKIGNGGDCFFIANQVENHGSVEAPGGSIGFAAGQTVTLSERPDGRGMSMNVVLPQGSVDNYGNVIADGGVIALNAKVVNQNGMVQANSVQDKNGVIELVAADELNLGTASQISAAGDGSAGGSAGGDVVLKSGNIFSDTAGSTVVTTGGLNGGDGGNVEVSAPNIQSLNSAMDASAKTGSKGGQFLLDPDSISLGTSGTGVVPDDGTVDASDPGTLNLNVNTAFANKNFSAILLQATGDITVKANATWNLGASTGENQGQVTLEAGGNIIFNSNAKITDSQNWSLSLLAGYDFVNSVVAYGGGNIYLNGGDGLSGNGAIQLAKGNLNMLAGQDILIGSGYARTSAGGGITAEALAGNIDTGTYAHGYVFNSTKTLGSSFYKVDPVNGTGGISTMAGGDVSIVAGGNVTSFMPSGNDASSIGGDAGSGAFGPQAGNVSVVAGGNVSGHFIEANGTGHIYAGVKLNAEGYPVDADGNPVKDSGKNYVLDPASGGDAGTPDAKLALSLVSGGWTVDAAQDINLQELRNPNGIFNRFTSGVTTPPTYHYFDYSAGAYLNLMAGNGVNLGDGASSLPRDDADGIDVPFIYAPILNIIAGKGGVTMGGDGDPYNKLILFPSPQGSLTIVTSGHGSLSGSLPPNSDGSPSIFDLIVSDSGQTQYYDSGLDLFGLNDHASTPVHEGSPTPIYLNIAGDMNGIQLGAPEAAQITIGGDMVNSRFQGMNLSGSDVTSIHVTGDIKNRSEFTTIDGVDTAPDLSLLTQAFPANALAANLAKSIFYDSKTKELTIQGAVTAQVLALLQNLQIQVYKNGVPQFKTDGSPQLATVSVIDGDTATKLQNQYATDGPVPTTRDSGYLIGGGGKFDISARNIDLGTTLGIQAQGVGFDLVATTDAGGNTQLSYPLAKYFNQGADIHVHADNGLEMFSTTISSLNGSSVLVDAGGQIDVGSAIFTGNSAAARGIFTTGLGDVQVVAGGDINVNGSRIAAYDGGNVTVESLSGDINAGTGGSGYVVVNSFSVDPKTHDVTSVAPTIPGSGILATSFPQDPTRKVGNILVETPNGNISASSGGIVQLPLNNADNSQAVVAVLAGYEMRDGQGNRVDAGHLGGATPVPILSDQNLVAFGTPIQVVPAGSILPVQLIPVLDVHGQPLLSNGSPLYVQGSDKTQQVVTFDLTDNKIKPYLAEGNDVNINTLKDEKGNPIATVLGRNIDASGSGIIAGTAKLAGTGNILGVIFARQNIDLAAVGNVNVTALAQGSVNVNSGGSISGTIIGVGGINASGGSIDANLESNSGIAGDTSGTKGFAQGTTANSASTAASAENTDTTTTKKTDDQEEDPMKKKKGIALAQKVSRVTVILPKKD
ncbi:MAG TPA: filamentous hemagglutinin N-terminal domain-containing protein [Verrucomicrobiae bacterium]|nr:filamentous hemagglutinin N-terminal domain-containing protein [Verrucomicrobiae bacterium]